MIKLFNAIFGQPATMSISHVADLKKEDPKVEQIRQRAKAKMKEWGRKTLTEGGHFDLNNRVISHGAYMKTMTR